MHFRRLFRFAAVASVGLAVVACGGGNTGGGGGNKGTISIGVDLPLSGEEGSQGTPTLNGVKFAASQKGSIGGYSIQVKAFDDVVNGAHDAQKGAQNVQQMLSDNTVVAMVGPFNSSVARAELPVANAAHLTMISPANTNQCLTKDIYIPGSLSGGSDVTCKTAGLPAAKDLRPSGPNNYFRVATTDDLQGPANADYAFNTLKLTKVGVASDNEVYGKGIADTFAARFKKDGGQVVGTRLDFDAKNTSDFRGWLQQEKAAGATAIYFGGVTANKGCVLRSQMIGIFDTGEKTPFLGGDGIAQDPSCTKDAGQNAAGIYGTVATANPDETPSAQSTISAFKKAYPNKADYGSYTIPAYDAAGVIMAAIKKVLDKNSGNWPSDVAQAREQVRAAVAATSSYSGAMGTFGFDANGDTTQKVVAIYEDNSTDPNADWPYKTAVDFSKTPL
jgi:branched-chain amino acid transport system substrate-binding protein